MDRVDEMLPVLSPFPNTVPVGFTSLANPRVHTKQGVWLDSCYQNHRDSSQIPGFCPRPHSSYRPISDATNTISGSL